MGKAPFLFPATVIRPFSGCEPSITNVSISVSATMVEAMDAAIVLTGAADTRAGLGDADAVHP